MSPLNADWMKYIKSIGVNLSYPLFLGIYGRTDPIFQILGNRPWTTGYGTAIWCTRTRRVLTMIHVRKMEKMPSIFLSHGKKIVVTYDTRQEQDGSLV